MMPKCARRNRQECPIFVASWMPTATRGASTAQIEGNDDASSVRRGLSASGLASVSASDVSLVKPGAQTAVGSPTTDLSSSGPDWLVNATAAPKAHRLGAP